MKVAIVSEVGGLIGSEICRELNKLGFTVVGLDNDIRAYFFSGVASTALCTEELIGEVEPLKV